MAAASINPWETLINGGDCDQAQGPWLLDNGESFAEPVVMMGEKTSAIPFIAHHVHSLQNHLKQGDTLLKTKQAEAEKQARLLIRECEEKLQMEFNVKSAQTREELKQKYEMEVHAVEQKLREEYQGVLKDAVGSSLESLRKEYQALKQTWREQKDQDILKTQKWTLECEGLVVDYPSFSTANYPSFKTWLASVEQIESQKPIFSPLVVPTERSSLDSIASSALGDS